ncbi:hypothetical protein STAS_23616 [Striga asiatica]|uniref:Uncharacterized protein n=1 Tax=Striga asiatica TaxID=4170 RepID=A0A5A7QMY1_STRAF|nr:hypothetical protein STAS_23616 [Striga asiatica]
MSSPALNVPLLFGGKACWGAVPVQIRHRRGEVAPVAASIVQRRPGDGERRRDLHAGGAVPVPEGQGEGVVVEQPRADPLEEVEVPPVEGEEQPRLVDLESQVREAALGVRAVAVRAVDVGLLPEAAGVVRRELLHQLDRLRVLGQRGGSGGRLGRRADAAGGGGGGGRDEIGDVGGGRRRAGVGAAVDGAAVGPHGVAAVYEIWRQRFFG